MSFKFPSILTDAFKKQQPAAPSHLYAYKTRFSMLGTVGSGKTTVCGFIVLAAQTLSSDMPSFRCRILEGTSSVLDATSRLRGGFNGKAGRFPQKTTAYNTYAAESGLLMRWKGFLGEKRVQVPICDIAGEDIQVMIERFSKNIGGIGRAAYSAARNLVDYVKESDGFILTVPASKALGIKGIQLEKESTDIHFDPDVNLYRILDAVITHKEQSRGKPIKGIAVIITKWDLLRPYAENFGMDIYEPSGRGLTEFMDVCFPATSMILKDYGLENVKFFPSYVELERDSEGKPKTWPEGDEKILIKGRRKPSYDEQTYINLIEWLRGFAN